nr:hypothetical protein [Tanacetum cinerariifolium]
ILRDLHGRGGVRCAGRATAVEGSRIAAPDARGAVVRNPGRPGQRRAGDRPLAEPAGLSPAFARPAGSHDRLLRLGQGCG